MQQYYAACPECGESDYDDSSAIQLTHLEACPVAVITSALATPADASALDALLAQARAEERERCRAAVFEEHLRDPVAGSASDEAYDRAIDDALAAIDALKGAGE